MLSDEDEIIFVDWNTPEDMPVLLVSIADTLTSKTKNILKLITIDPEMHSRVSRGSHRKVLEPIARNVGIRMTDSDSDWVLSTNTDMLFYFPKDNKLSDILENRAPALLTMFRNEIPEYFWDSLDRSEPEKTNALLSKIATSCLRRNIILSNVVNDELLHYPDGVGDFQLAPRSFWFKMQGFAEDKLLGWHNDTRLVIQMIKKLKCHVELLSSAEIVGFHQNHYRSLVEGQDNSNVNSTSTVFLEYDNNKMWGLSEEKLVKIPFLNLEKENQRDFLSPEKIPSSGPAEQTIIESLESIHNSLTDDYRRSLFFLVDDISVMKYGGRVIYIGWNSTFFASLSSRFDDQLVVFNCRVSEKAETTLEHIKQLNIGHKDLVLIDLGLDIRLDKQRELIKMQESHKFVDEIDHENWRQLAIGNVNFIPLIGNYLRENHLETKVGFLRNQNWPTLQLTRCYFQLPLFNNYSGYLSGRVRKNFSSRILIRGFTSAAVGQYLTLQNQEWVTPQNQEWVTPRVVSNLMRIQLYRYYKGLPNRIKSPIRKAAFRLFS
jgi:hypothetical protein